LILTCTIIELTILQLKTRLVKTSFKNCPQWLGFASKMYKVLRDLSKGGELVYHLSLKGIIDKIKNDELLTKKS
jgi:hypothetical protein